MRRFYEFKVKYPEFCKNLLPATGSLGFEHNIVNFQPRRDQHGRRILTIKGGSEFFNEFHDDFLVDHNKHNFLKKTGIQKLSP